MTASDRQEEGAKWAAKYPPTHLDCGSERASDFVARAGLHVARGQIGIMEHQNAGNLAIAPEAHGNSHVQLGRIQVRQVEKADGRLMAVHALDLLFPIAGPERPERQVGPIRCRKQR